MTVDMVSNNCFIEEAILEGNDKRTDCDTSQSYGICAHFESVCQL